MNSLYILLICVVAIVPLAAISFLVIVVANAAVKGFLRLFRKKEPLPCNPDIFPIIPEENE